MIERFRHKGLKLLFEEGDPTGVNPQHVEKIENVLGLLDVAQDIEDMNVPTFRLHALKGDLRPCARIGGSFSGSPTDAQATST